MVEIPVSLPSVYSSHGERQCVPLLLLEFVSLCKEEEDEAVVVLEATLSTIGLPLVDMGRAIR